MVGDVKHREQEVATVDLRAFGRRTRSEDLSVEDRGVEIDEMPPFLTRRTNLHRDVALTVERAAVAEVGVVDHDGIDVPGLRPSAALEVDRDRLSGTDDGRRDRLDAR